MNAAIHFLQRKAQLQMSDELFQELSGFSTEFIASLSLQDTWESLTVSIFIQICDVLQCSAEELITGDFTLSPATLKDMRLSFKGNPHEKTLTAIFNLLKDQPQSVWDAVLNKLKS